MKSEVYSWRLTPDLKGALKDAARREHVSVSRLLERITREWLKARAPEAENYEAEQARLRAAAAPYIGSISSGDPELSEKVRERMIEYLERKYPR